MGRYLPVFVVALLLLSATAGGAQQPCGMPAVATTSREPNILTPQQAELLGDLVMRQVAGDLRLVNDPALNRYAQAIADRMAVVSGAGTVRVELFDLPSVNAFTFPGGRVLLARKLVAFARSEDEVAGVLAHELAHVLMRGPERRFSRALRAALQVTTIGNARDLEEKYHRLIDNARRSSAGAGQQNSEADELAADQLAVWLMTRVGYPPKAFIDFWDRVNELQAETGNWLSDLFGTTKPGSRRLRGAVKAAAELPASCAGTRPTTDAEFAQWQQSIVAASRVTPEAALHGTISERKLDPPLRSDLSHLKFSPDGRWVLAQDDASVHVFSREPLAFKWRADASDALPAQFSPDSTALVFYDDDYRVERWDLSSGQREWVRELLVAKGCVEAALSPDGAYFACVTPEFDLHVQQVASGDTVFQKRGFYKAELRDVREILAAPPAPSDRRTHMFQMQFSPDVRYLVAARHDTSIGVDLVNRVAIPLPGSIRSRVGLSFAFMGPDRIAGVHDSKPEDSAILTFPGGAVLTKLKLGPCLLSVPTRGDRSDPARRQRRRGRAVRYQGEQARRQQSRGRERPVRRPVRDRAQDRRGRDLPHGNHRAARSGRGPGRTARAAARRRRVPGWQRAGPFTADARCHLGSSHRPTHGVHARIPRRSRRCHERRAHRLPTRGGRPARHRSVPGREPESGAARQHRRRPRQRRIGRQTGACHRFLGRAGDGHGQGGGAARTVPARLEAR